MSKPLLLDLFCGAGGAGMGYHRAGFEVVGVDITAQPRYPFVFRQGDALECLDTLLRGKRWGGYRLRDFAVIHASPPCQRYSVANNVHKLDHPDLLPATRERLIRTRLPWAIENVPGAPMLAPVLVCGLTLGCNVKRHRLFESNVLLFGTGCPRNHPGDWLLVWGHTVQERGHVSRRGPTGNTTHRKHRKHTTTERGRAAMGIDWMNRDELSEAIPPAYTHWIGQQLMNVLEVAA